MKELLEGTTVARDYNPQDHLDAHAMLLLVAEQVGNNPAWYDGVYLYTVHGKYEIFNDAGVPAKKKVQRLNQVGVMRHFEISDHFAYNDRCVEVYCKQEADAARKRELQEAEERADREEAEAAEGEGAASAESETETEEKKE